MDVQAGDVLLQDAAPPVLKPQRLMMNEKSEAKTAEAAAAPGQHRWILRQAHQTASLKGH